MVEKINTRCARGKPQRVYTLDDGSKLTALELQSQLNEKWGCEVTLFLARSRLNKSTNPKKVFAKPIKTRPRKILTIEEKDTAREMMKLALKNI
jgi:hypothetical protein